MKDKSLHWTSSVNTENVAKWDDIREEVIEQIEKAEMAS